MIIGRGVNINMLPKNKSGASKSPLGFLKNALNIWNVPASGIKFVLRLFAGMRKKQIITVMA